MGFFFRLVGLTRGQSLILGFDKVCIMVEYRQVYPRDSEPEFFILCQVNCIEQYHSFIAIWALVVFNADVEMPVVLVSLDIEFSAIS